MTKPMIARCKLMNQTPIETSRTSNEVKFSSEVSEDHDIVADDIVILGIAQATELLRRNATRL